MSPAPHPAPRSSTSPNLPLRNVLRSETPRVLRSSQSEGESAATALPKQETPGHAAHHNHPSRVRLLCRKLHTSSPHERSWGTITTRPKWSLITTRQHMECVAQMHGASLHRSYRFRGVKSFLGPEPSLQPTKSATSRRSQKFHCLEAQRPFRPFPSFPSFRCHAALFSFSETDF